MPLRILATQPNPELVRLPWDKPLEEWGDDVVLPLPRGISRHVVRIVRNALEKQNLLVENRALRAQLEERRQKDIVGTSLAYSLRKYVHGAAVDSAVYWRIARRTSSRLPGCMLKSVRPSASSSRV